MVLGVLRATRKAIAAGAEQNSSSLIQPQCGHCSRAEQSHSVIVNMVLPLYNLLTNLDVDKRVAHVY